MSLELLGRVHKELSITGSALYEAVLAISERVNRKVQIIRLHWHASMVLERMDRLTAEVGSKLVDQVARRFLTKGQPDSTLVTLDATLTSAAARVQEYKQSLLEIDAQIRELRLEAIHEDLLGLHHDLSSRSGGIERLTIVQGAPAVGHSIAAMPQSSSVRVSVVLRGPFLLAPDENLSLRPGDIVILIGIRTELDHVAAWFTSKRPMRALSATTA